MPFFLIFSKIVDKIDSDNDGLVTEKELHNWIEYTQKRYINDDVKRQWNANNPENKETLHWSEYKAMVYGFMDSKYKILNDIIFVSIWALLH